MFGDSVLFLRVSQQVMWRLPTVWANAMLLYWDICKVYFFRRPKYGTVGSDTNSK